MSASKPGLIRRTFRWLWNLVTWLRVSLANLLFLVILAVIIIALIPKEVKPMPDKIALRVAPSGFLVDQYSYIDPLTELIDQSSSANAETRVWELVKAIDAAANDDRITALVLDLNHLIGGGLSKLEEIGRALTDFKASGKPVYAISDNFSHDQYYLASYADEVLMHPMGAVILTGYGSYRNYFKSALDKLEVNMHVFRVGEYKDAVEPYLRNDMSEASREHNSQWLNELWSTYTSRVEQGRQLGEGAINSYINQLDEHLSANGGDPAATALSLGLVDQLASHGQQSQFLIERVGKDKEQEDYRALDYGDYLGHIDKPHLPGTSKVGLIVAKGVILDGDQPAGNIGGDSLSQLIRDARENEGLKALVLRVDSGGGSAFASELIRQELELTRQQGIPVFVSMGSVAASGGYWIAMGADQVWAQPTTITGSIGVFSAFPTLEHSLQKLGISTDGIGTTELAGALRVDRPLSPLAQNVLQQSVDSIYQHFLALVAQNRQTSPAQVHEVGQGRVWTGRAAKDLGLVDELGDLQAVIQAAAAEAGLKDFQLLEIQKPLTPSEQLAKQFMGEMAALLPASSFTSSPLMSLLQASEEQLKPLAKLVRSGDRRSVYAHCLECVAP